MGKFPRKEPKGRQKQIRRQKERREQHRSKKHRGEDDSKGPPK